MVVHERIQELTQSFTKTAKTIYHRCGQANKRESDAESKTIEVKKLVACSRNEVHIFKTTLNQIKIHVNSMEAVTNTNISKVKIAIQDPMTFNIEKDNLDSFGKELQTNLVPKMEGILVKIQQLELNQVRSLGYINLIMIPSRTPVFFGIKGIENWVKIELTTLSANIYSKPVYMKGCWFRSLNKFILFYQKQF